MGKFICYKFECEKCKVLATIQAYYNKSNQLRYGRARHYLKMVDGKPTFSYCVQSKEYLEEKIKGLTQNGKDFLEEQKKIREKFSQDSGFLASPFFDRFFGNIPEEKTKQVRGSMRRLFVSSIKLAKALKQNYSENELDEALKVLDEASAKLEGIRSKIANEK